MKVALYCRLSEEDKEKRALAESGSIQNQKNMLLQYAQEWGWEVYDIYSDDDYTGADRNRPAFCRLLVDAEHKKFQIILCKTQSRFTRELELVEKYIHGLFPIWGIRFVSIVDNGDTDNKGNKKSRQINGLMNEWYLEDMSENIRSVLKNRRQRGLHTGAFALYGYIKDPDCKGKLQIDPNAAAIVREVFVLYSHGMGKTAIARQLNERGVPNPSEYKRLQGLAYRQKENSTLWKYPSIASMLTNEMYCGHMVQGRYGSVSYKTKQNKSLPKSQWVKVEHTHEAIISEALWQSVQKRIVDKAKTFPSTGKTGIFSGKVKCIFCGSALGSTQNRGRYYLRCTTAQVSKKHCKGAFIAVERLEELVLQELHMILAQYLEVEVVRQQWKSLSGAEDMRKGQEVERKGYQKQRDHLALCLRQLYQDKVRGVITLDEFSLLSQEFRQEAERVEKQISATDSSLQSLGDVDENALISSYLKPKHLTRIMVEELVETVRVGKREVGSQEVPVEIRWDF